MKNTDLAQIALYAIIKEERVYLITGKRFFFKILRNAALNTSVSSTRAYVVPIFSLSFHQSFYGHENNGNIIKVLRKT